jgi:hypothetical protein
VIEEALTTMVARGTLALKLPPASAALLLETYTVGMVACAALGQSETDAERRACLETAFSALTA